MKKSKIEGRRVFAVSDFSDKTLVERTKRSRHGTLLSLSGPNPDADVSIGEIDNDNFNLQRQHLEQGSSVRDWDDGPFHFGSELVLAAWICGEMGADSLVFVGEFPNPSPMVPEVLSKIIEEYGLPLKFTHANDFVQRLDAEPDLEEDEIVTYPYEIELLDQIFANTLSNSVFQEADSVEIARDRRKTSSETDVTVRWGEGEFGKDSDFRFIRSVSEGLLELPRTRVVFFGRNVRRCVEICEGHHTIYLPSSETEKALTKIQKSELSEIKSLSLAARTTLVVAMASTYESFKTFGVLDDVSNRERQFLKRIESIEHA